MKHILVVGRKNIDHLFCSICYAKDAKSRVVADVLVEEMPHLPSENELLPHNRTVYGLCANHAEVENLVQ